MINFVKNVGELKQYLDTLPDDLPIVRYHSDMEKSGYFEGAHITVMGMTKGTHHTYDAFDHTPYTYESYSCDQNGTQTMVL